MANIKYATILNSFVSTEGSNGYMTNYVYYSVLVAYDNGTKEITEGKANQISFLMPYIVTPQDCLEELEKTVKALRSDMNEIADQKLNYVIDSLYPIPEILGLNEVEARDRLVSCGLTPNDLVTYPALTPKNGVVKAYRRNKENFRFVDLEVIHEVPDVEGLPLGEAGEILKKAGFHWKTRKKINTQGKDNIVEYVSRSDDRSLELEMSVLIHLNDLTGLTKEAAEKEANRVGYELFCEDDFNNRPAGTVLSWNARENGTIHARISKGPRILTARFADITPDELMTVEDFSACYDFERNSLELKLGFLYNSKQKRKLMAATVVMNDQKLPARLNDYPVMQAGSSVSIQIKADGSFDRTSLPGSFALVLHTQTVGLSKKDEDIRLQVTVSW